MNKKIYSDIIFDLIHRYNIESNDDFESTKKSFGNISLESYDITNEYQSKTLGKEIGKYRLLSVPCPLDISHSETTKIVNILKNILYELMGNITNKDRVLIVGLGNRHISADSLGTKVIKRIGITFGGHFPKVMAICPSVLGLTGIETFDIVKGVIDNVKPTHIIFIDSLCASNVSRLGKSIQLTNTGICPGSGVGNKRKCLNSSLAKHVVSIGVPLLIYANTFVGNNMEKYRINHSRLNSIMQKIKKYENNSDFVDLINDLKACTQDSIDDIIVSLKDIEECVDILSKIISKAINLSLGVNVLND